MNKKVWSYQGGCFEEEPSLLHALDLRTAETECFDSPVVSAVGAGGKTTLLCHLAEEFVQSGSRVVVTTTTHIMYEDRPYFLSGPAVGDIKESLKHFPCVWAGMPAAGGKLKALPEDVLKEIFKWKLPVLIEADGARRMPLKVPARHEPVILPESTHVLSVYGLDAVGKPMGEICFRPELAEGLLGKNRTEPVTAEDLVLLAASEYAGRKDCKKDIAYMVVLNKADNPKRRAYALKICRQLDKRQIKSTAVSFCAE